MNVFGLQGVRTRALPVAAATLPAANDLMAPGAEMPQSMAINKPASPPDPVGQIMGSADADLSVRTAIGADSQPSTPASPLDTRVVASIQRELAARGYDPGRITGSPGILTRAAILAFEFDNHFALTAEPSEELMRQIVLGMSGRQGSILAPPTEKAKRLIAGAQRLLVRLGYNPGVIGGQLNETTRKALRHFETDMGLSPKGRVSGEVLSELARRAHARIEVSDEALSN